MLSRSLKPGRTIKKVATCVKDFVLIRTAIWFAPEPVTHIATADVFDTRWRTCAIDVTKGSSKQGLEPRAWSAYKNTARSRVLRISTCLVRVCKVLDFPVMGPDPRDLRSNPHTGCDQVI